MAKEASQRDDFLGACGNVKINALVGTFRQNVSLKEGMYRTVNYYFSHRETLGIDYAFGSESDRIIVKYIKEFNLRCIRYHFLYGFKEC